MCFWLYVSQRSVAKHMRCDVIFNDTFIKRAESDGERILYIGLHFAKLWLSKSRISCFLHSRIYWTEDLGSFKFDWNKLCAWRHDMPRPSPPRGRPSASRAAEQTQRSSSFLRPIRSHGSLVASTMPSSTSTSTGTRGASTSTSTSTWSPSPSTSTSTKYNRTKLHNLEHFTKIFTEVHRVKVKHTQQLVLDSTSGTTHSLIYTESMQRSCT